MVPYATQPSPLPHKKEKNKDWQYKSVIKHSRPRCYHDINPIEQTFETEQLDKNHENSTNDGICVQMGTNFREGNFLTDTSTMLNTSIIQTNCTKRVY